MPQSKRPRLLAGSKKNDDVHHDDLSTANKLSVDVVAIIFSFLPLKDIMRLRRVCSKWKEAAKKTIVPLSDFVIGGLVKYNAMRVMSTALPNLQQISIQYLGVGRKYSDGEEPDEQEAAETRSFSTHDIGISNFAKLRILTIWQAPLNGRYPVLFNFPLLQKLKIWNCRFLKWDLDMLAGLPVLKELTCAGNDLRVTGNLSSLRVLKDTLETVQISNCDNIDGNFMDLADFPRLNWLNLQGTNVTGDIRDIGENDFTALVTLRLPKSVYGGIGYEFRSIAEASDFFSRIYPRVVKRNEKRFRFCYWKLSKESPDWYIGDDDQTPPPFEFELVIITGSRVGWRWKSTCCYSDGGYDSVEEMTSSCEINWLEPEPDRESSGYEDYTRKLNALQEEIDFYRGYNQPPTEEEYHRLCEESADY